MNNEWPIDRHSDDEHDSEWKPEEKEMGIPEKLFIQINTFGSGEMESRSFLVLSEKPTPDFLNVFEYELKGKVSK